MIEPNDAPDLRILTAVSPEEAAAVTAVLLAALAGRGERGSAAPARDTGRWVRAAGAVRAPFETGPSRWASWGR